MSELPELPEGMSWSAHVNSSGLLRVHLNSAPPHIGTYKSHEVKLNRNFTAEELEVGIASAATAILLSVQSDIQRMDVIQRVRMKLGVPISGD